MRAGLPLPDGAPLDAPAAIAMLLERRGCTSRQLARELGVNPVTLSRWLNGRNRPRGAACGEVMPRREGDRVGGAGVTHSGAFRSWTARGTSGAARGTSRGDVVPSGPRGQIATIIDDSPKRGTSRYLSPCLGSRARAGVPAHGSTGRPPYAPEAEPGLRYRTSPRAADSPLIVGM